jgi:hypothetical protein
MWAESGYWPTCADFEEILPTMTIPRPSVGVDTGLILKALDEAASQNMFAVVFSILAIMAIISSCSEIVMRVRLTKREPSGDKLAWWRRGGDEVAAMYQELFPRTRLPLFRRFAFWLLVAWSLVALLSVLWKSY